MSYLILFDSTMMLYLCNLTALVYSPMESAFGHLRGKQDLGNSALAGAITGALYKSAGEKSF